MMVTTSEDVTPSTALGATSDPAADRTVARMTGMSEIGKIRGKTVACVTPPPLISFPAEEG